MDKPNEGLNEESTINSRNREILLVISIDKNGKIVQFNKECEKITGYKRYEALNKEFFDFLIPENYFEPWKRMFDSAKRDEVINDLKLPWLTRQGQEVMISWSSFPVEGVESEIEDICLVGKLIVPDIDAKESLLEHIKEGLEDKESIIEFIKNGIEHETEHEADAIDKIDSDEKDETIFNLGNKRIIFKKTISGSPRAIDDISEKKISSGKEEKKKPLKTEPVKTVMEKKIDKSDEPPVPNYRGVDKIIEELEKKNKQLEEENKKLEKNLKSLKTRLSSIKKEKKSKTSTVFDSLRGKDKQEEFENIIHELDERKSLLDNLETQLIKEKEDINNQRDEFFKWREKLEALEEEIENRRQELVEQEREFSNRFVSSLDESVPDKSAGISEGLPFDIKKEEETSEHHEILDKIQEGAAIVQRGILKQVNRPFVELIGYNMEELLEKSLLDFVVQEGFSGIERYYLNRLKGESASSFETVFLTKDDNKLAVEVSIKPTVFNGEKADIAVFNKVAGAQEVSTVDKVEEKPAELPVEEPAKEPEVIEEPPKEEKQEEPPKETPSEPEPSKEDEKPAEEPPKEEEKPVEVTPSAEKIPEPEVKEEMPAEEPPKEEIPEPPKEEEKPAKPTEEVKEEKPVEEQPKEEKTPEPEQKEETPVEEPPKEETKEEPTEPPEEEGIKEKPKDKSKEAK